MTADAVFRNKEFKVTVVIYIKREEKYISISITEIFIFPIPNSLSHIWPIILFNPFIISEIFKSAATLFCTSNENPKNTCRTLILFPQVSKVQKGLPWGHGNVFQKLMHIHWNEKLMWSWFLWNHHFSSLWWY